VARAPEGDLILCDVAREDASVVIADLRELGIERDGAIAVDSIGTLLAAPIAPATRSVTTTPHVARAGRRFGCSPATRGPAYDR